VPGEQIGAIESAMKDLEDAMKSDDKDRIEARATALEQAAQSLAAAAGSAHGPAAEAGAGAQQSAGRADDVVDAEFTEVKDKK
jgi:molecular chaperone DnaK